MCITIVVDLGKVLLLPSFGGLPQWAVVGDTFPLGCAFDPSIVHYEVRLPSFLTAIFYGKKKRINPKFQKKMQHFKGSLDYENPKYNSKLGVYAEGCGLENVMMSWGHDDYMYLVRAYCFSRTSSSSTPQVLESPPNYVAGG